MLNVRKTLGKLLNRQAALLPSDTTFVEQKTLLWENPRPTSNFATQTVLTYSALASYDKVEIICNAFTASPYHYDSSYFVEKDKNGILSTTLYADGYGIARECAWATGDGLHFNDAYVEKTVNNEAMIPKKIYGIKRIYGGGHKLAYLLHKNLLREGGAAC